jgi:shikimate kinase
MTRHLVLIGLMGVGKTTVGQVVAERLGWTFHDSDRSIEAATGMTVKQILADSGLSELRRHEADALFDALDRDQPGVISAAAGVVLDPDHVHRLQRADAEVVWLTAEPDLLAHRTSSRGHRPWLDDDPLGTLQRMERERRNLYESVADRVVPVDGLTPDEIADRIVA